jgi:DNA-binding GntR family transcriptional regulator
MGVSRTPLREAIGKLVEDGWSNTAPTAVTSSAH